MSAEENNQNTTIVPRGNQFLTLTAPTLGLWPFGEPSIEADRRLRRQMVISGKPTPSIPKIPGGNALHDVAVNHFEERMNRQCRYDKFGLLYRLDDAHPWADFWITPYRWTESDLHDYYVADASFIPKSYHELPRTAPGFLVTVAVLDQHSSEMTTNSVRAIDINKIKKARRGPGFLVHVPAIARKAETSHNRDPVDWPRSSSWVVIPPQQLGTEQVEDITAANEPKEFGPLTLRWDNKSVTKYFAPNQMDSRSFMRMLVDLMHDGEAMVNADFPATRVNYKEVTKTMMEVTAASFYN